MAKLTLQQRLVDALVATGRGTIVPSRSRRYVTLERPDGSFFYVGPAGALRFGKTVTDSMAAPTSSSGGCSRTQSNNLRTDDAAGRSAQR